MNKEHAMNNPAVAKQRGIGIVELSVAAVIGLITVALILAYAPDLFASSKGDDEIGALGRIIPSIQGAARNENDYSTFTAARIQNEGILPTAYLTGVAGTFRNRFDGVTTFATATRATANDTLVLTETNWPQSACLRVVRALDGQVTRVQVNGVTVKAFGAALNQTLLTTNCAAAPVTVALAFGK